MEMDKQWVETDKALMFNKMFIKVLLGIFARV
jgi:hypothetical protein